MVERITSICNHVLTYSFYALFFIIPLTFTSNTYELFEFNKMWLTFTLAVFIACAWGIKMVLQGGIFIQRTPLDLPILLFLLSQIISTIFSLDPHVSIWGYYSRFNGGLLSIICYIFLYYALTSNYRDLENSNNNPVLNSVQNTFKIKPFFAQSLLLACASLLFVLGFITFVWWQHIPYNPLFTTIIAFLSSKILILFIISSFLLFVFSTTGKFIHRLLTVGIISGVIIALWGLPSHFGADPTCFLFRYDPDVSFFNNFNVNCWTESFQPKIRIFSTFGQPNWLAAYLAILLPIAISHLLMNLKPFTKNSGAYLVSRIMYFAKNIPPIHSTLYIILITAFYVCLLFTGSQSGLVGFGGAFLVMAFFLGKMYAKAFVALAMLFVLIAFFLGLPLKPLEKFTFPSLYKQFAMQQTEQTPSANSGQAFAGELGGTDSGTIRKIVWKGALDIWKNNLAFGTGVETFAFAYYKHRPVEHNLTSEWDYLYNKAHNEYLNFLATTGILGLGSYLLMIGTFIFISVKQISKSEFLISKQIPNSKSQLGQLEIRSISLIAAYVSILISNFFGFSVVIINLYFYLIPAILFVHLGLIKSQNAYTVSFKELKIKNYEFWKKLTQWFMALFIILPSLLMLLILYRFWHADTYYAKGYNFNRGALHDSAYPLLQQAILLRSGEPVFQDEYSYNAAVLSLSLAQDDQATSASELASEAEFISDYVVENHPHNVVFWKTRVRVFYALSQLDASYLPKALEAIKKASELAPTDAKISYNLGILYGQNDQAEIAAKTLEHTVKLKPDYVDGWYALGLYYRELATDEKGKVTDSALQKKAIDTMQYIIKTFSKEQAQPAQEALQAWDVL